jgi:hypothetical protein
MAKVANRTPPAGAGATLASPRSENPDTDLTAIYAIVGEFVCGASQAEQSKECSKKGRAQRIMEITAEASERLDELEARIAAHPNPQIESEQTARRRRLASEKTSTPLESSCEYQVELAAIRTAQDLLTRQYGKAGPKYWAGVRIVDTVMGWIIVVGLFVWVNVLRFFGPDENKRATRRS